MSADEETVLECARALRLIAADIRNAGDLRQVMLTEDGVADHPVTVSDELWLIALRLDGKMEPLRLPDDDPHPGRPYEQTADPEPQPTDGPDYHADHAAWERRQTADPEPGDTNADR